MLFLISLEYFIILFTLVQFIYLSFKLTYDDEIIYIKDRKKVQDMDDNDMDLEQKSDVNDLLEKIDGIELIPDEELEKMDFYQLAYYMQTLNMIDSLDGNDGDING